MAIGPCLRMSCRRSLGTPRAQRPVSQWCVPLQRGEGVTPGTPLGTPSLPINQLHFTLKKIINQYASNC